MCIPCAGQGLEGIRVETYHVQPVGEGESPLMTYRIFVDLAPEHALLVIYGDERNQLEIRTTTYFVNDTLNGAKFAHEVPSKRLNADPGAALDSWLTMKMASDMHWGIPRDQDPDGSILTCPPYMGLAELHSSDHAQRSVPLCVNDGLIDAPEVRTVENFRFSPGFLGRIQGSLVHTMDGAWGVLGGAKGVGEDNMVLIAQITTSGELSFRLNLQVKPLDGGPLVKYVSTEALEDEILFPGLRLGTPDKR